MVREASPSLSPTQSQHANEITDRFTSNDILVQITTEHIYLLFYQAQFTSIVRLIEVRTMAGDKKTATDATNYGGRNAEYEFGGPWGVLALMIWSHYILIYFW